MAVRLQHGRQQALPPLLSVARTLSTQPPTTRSRRSGRIYLPLFPLHRRRGDACTETADLSLFPSLPLSLSARRAGRARSHQRVCAHWPCSGCPACAVVSVRVSTWRVACEDREDVDGRTRARVARASSRSSRLHVPVAKIIVDTVVSSYIVVGGGEPATRNWRRDDTARNATQRNARKRSINRA